MTGLRFVFGMAASCFRRRLRGFTGDRRGAAALEFAILAPIFFMLLFAILECCITFGAQQILTNATDDIGRDMRTGRIRPEGLTTTVLHDMFCDRMPALFSSGCPGLKIDVRNFDTFEKVADEFSKGIVPATFRVDLGGPLSKNIMRVFYEWPVILTVFNDRVEDPKSGKTLLFATQTWQNEPFD